MNVIKCMVCLQVFLCLRSSAIYIFIFFLSSVSCLNSPTQQVSPKHIAFHSFPPQIEYSVVVSPPPGRRGPVCHIVYTLTHTKG